MLTDFRELRPSAISNSDVLIVGAGAVGLSMAVDLARRGLTVTLLEAGSTSIEERSQAFFKTAQWRGYPLEGLHAGRVRALGGTTNAWPGQLVPLDPIVFEHRPWVADEGWPIDRATLDPYYKRAFDQLRLRRQMADDEVWRYLDLPVPDLGQDLDIFLTRWTPEPRFAVLFREAIIHNPRLQVLFNAPVTGLSLDKDGLTIRHVVVNRSDGTKQCFSARHIVLANGTVEIARLLCMPLAEGYAAPWASNPWLGRGFADHVDSYAGSVELLNPKRFHAMFDGILLRGLKYTPKIKLSGAAQRRKKLLGIAVQFLFDSHYKADLDRLKVPVKALLHGRIDKRVLSIPALTMPLARIAVPLAVRYLRHRRALNVADRGIQLRLSSEQIPLKTSCLHLCRERDALGMPKIGIEWLLDGAELETMAECCEMIANFFERERLARIELNPRLKARDPAFLSEIDDGNHQMGMARMATTSARGVGLPSSPRQVLRIQL